MSEDLTKKFPKSGPDKENMILTAVDDLGKSMRSSMENLVTWVGNIDTRLQRLEQKVEERLYDTRPIWQKVLEDIGKLQKGQTKIQETLQAETNEIKNSLLDLYRGQTALNDVVLKVHRDFHDLDGRVDSLATNHNSRNSST